MTPDQLLTEDERVAFDASAELWNVFLKLPVQHDDDVRDLRFHIHAIQNLILCRPVCRLLVAKSEK